MIKIIEPHEALIMTVMIHFRHSRMIIIVLPPRLSIKANKKVKQIKVHNNTLRYRKSISPKDFPSSDAFRTKRK